MSIQEQVTKAVLRHMVMHKLTQRAMSPILQKSQAQVGQRLRNEVPWTLRDIERLQNAGVEIPGIAVGHHAGSVVIDDPALLVEEG